MHILNLILKKGFENVLKKLKPEFECMLRKILSTYSSPKAEAELHEIFKECEIDIKNVPEWNDIRWTIRYLVYSYILTH